MHLDVPNLQNGNLSDLFRNVIRIDAWSECHSSS